MLRTSLAQVARAIGVWPVGKRPRGRILAVKLGYNPNSSSLGVDVTFLLFGLGAVTLLTPVIATLLRLRKPPPA